MDNSGGARGPTLFRYRFGDAEFDESRYELSVGGQPVEAERRALEVLAYLLRHADEVVTKDELLSHVWAGRITVDKVLPNAVMKLRRALGEDNAQLLLSLPRTGYRLTGVTERMAVGRRMSNRLGLVVGHAVPQREHFRLTQQLGATRGSEVWLAQHAKTRELRVYKFAADGDRLGALKREATLSRVLAESLGPREDISRVIDWNFAEAPYFLECAYGGPNLQDWAASDTQPLGALDQTQRIDLFLQIADAVAAAHSVGVLHKDIKPANILISPRGEGWQVRLTDFGSGRLLEPGRLEELGITQLGMTITQKVTGDSSTGTPLYLAPELLAGQPPTVQSDVYALGIVLYQLVVGDLRRPLSSGWERDINDELLRDDIAQATQGDRLRRLSTVTQLVDRLRRLDQRRQLSARQLEIQSCIQAAERSLNAARARRPWIAAAVGVLLAGMVASGLLYLESRQQQIEAQRQAEIAGAIKNFLQSDLLSAASPNEAGQRDLTVREALARAESRIDKRFLSQPALAASLRLTLGEVQFALGNLPAAETQVRRALELLAGASPADAQALTARYQLALILAHESKFDEAQDLLKLADREYVASQAAPALVVVANYSHGMLKLQQQEEASAAIPFFERALEAQRIVDPDNAGAIIEVQTKLAQAFANSLRFEESDALSQAMLARYDPEDPTTALRLSLARMNYGYSLFLQERYREAESVLRQAYDEVLKGLGPDNYRATKGLADLAGVYASTGQWQLSRQTYQEVIAALSRQVGSDHALTLAMTGWLGAVEYEAGETGSAITRITQVREKLSLAYPEFGRPFIHCFGYYLAAAYTRRGALDEAEAILAGIDLTAAAASCDATVSARLDALHGQIALKRNDREKALPLLEHALRQLEEQHAPDFVLAPVRDALAGASHL